MKKYWLLVLTVAVVVCACMLLVACGETNPSNNGSHGYALNFNTVYALAEEAGYTGTLEDLIELFKGKDAYALACEAGYTGTQEEWLGTLIGATGKDGLTPTIGENKHWFVGDVDTGVVAEGKDGIQGPQGNPGKDAEVSISADGYWVINGTKTNVKAEGSQGIQGETGNGIKSIEKTGSEGLTDTYVITFSDDSTFPYTVTNGAQGATGKDAEVSISADGYWVINGVKTNDKAVGEQGKQGEPGKTGATGNGIARIEKTDSQDLVDTYTIYYTDGTTSTFTVTNGTDGADSAQEESYLDFYPLPDGTLGVKAGKALYLEEITIPATYHGKTVSTILKEGFGLTLSDLDEYDGDFDESITPPLRKINLPDTITTIAPYAFAGCTHLSTIELPDGLVKIGLCAFLSSGLESVTIPASLQSNDGGFWECDKLAEIRYAGSLATWCAMTGLEDLMQSGTSTKSLYIGGSKVEGALAIPEGVTSIGDFVFYGCKGLTSVTIPSSVTDIGERAFYDCSGLTSVTFAEGSKLISIGDQAFAGCSRLQYNEYENGLYMGNDSNPYLALYKAESTSTIHPHTQIICNYAFYRSGLTSITIPASVTSIGEHAFYDCSGLTSVTFAEGSKLISIGDLAFRGCSSLPSIDIPASVTTIGDQAFADCRELATITVANGNTTYHSDGNCLIHTADKRLIHGCKDSVIPNDGVTSIGERAFYDCSGLTSITIPDGVTTIESYAFYCCSDLYSINIPTSVTSIGDYVFYECEYSIGINYSGTKEQWDTIRKGSRWYGYSNYTIHCTDGDIAK